MKFRLPFVSKRAKNVGFLICFFVVMFTSQVVTSPRLISTVKSAAAIDFTSGYYRFRNSPSKEDMKIMKHMLENLPHPSMVCDDTHSGCCVSWNVNVDEWWMHHPDWRVVSENQTHSCFDKYPEPKATFFRKLYKAQWLDDGDNKTMVDGDDTALDIYNRTTLPPAKRNCSNVLQNFQVSSGMGASLGTVMKGLYAAHHMAHPRPYQLSKHWDGMQWLYIPPDNSSWAWCPTTDLNCYILPVSNCIPTYSHQDPVARSKFDTSYKWLMQYLLRYRHKVRWRIQNASDTLFVRLHYNTTQKATNIYKNNCTAIHVRRGDSGLSREPFRRYAGLSEYIGAGHIGHDELILLLTDDVTTIQEAKQFYPDYDWFYLERPRVKMTYGGFDGHIPSRDQAQEVVAIATEVAAGARCNKFVHASSGFIQQIWVAREGLGLGSPETYSVKTDISKAEAQNESIVKRGKDKRAELMVEKIFREAEEGLRLRMQQWQEDSTVI